MLLSQLGLQYERVHVDIFAGDTQTDAYLARNPAGRTPLLETEDGAAIPESGAILLYLAEGTPFLPDDRVERAHVHAWMFFEQNLLEPNVGTARFWRLTGRDGERPEAFARHLEAGAARLRRSNAASRGRTSWSAAAARLPTARSTRTRGSHTRRATTWPPTRRSRPGSVVSPRRRARSTTSSRTRARLRPGRVGGRRTTVPTRRAKPRLSG